MYVLFGILTNIEKSYIEFLKFLTKQNLQWSTFISNKQIKIIVKYVYKYLSK